MVTMGRNKIADLSIELGCSYNLAADLYRLGDEDSVHIIELSQTLGGVERLKTALLLERLEQIDESLEDLWLAVEGKSNE